MRQTFVGLHFVETTNFQRSACRRCPGAIIFIVLCQTTNYCLQEFQEILDKQSMASLQKPLRDCMKQLSNVQVEQIGFLSEAVLPAAKVAQCKGNLWEIYTCLCNSHEHKKISLHLMLYLLESADCPVDEISTKVKSSITCVIPRLALRKLLVDVANELNESAEELIGYAAEDLKIYPQKFQTQDAGHRVGLLELFKDALKQCLITDSDLSKLKEWLHKVDAKSILNDIIKGFDPNLPLCLPQHSPTGNYIIHRPLSSIQKSCDAIMHSIGSCATLN